jgi:hypothetical protein
MVRMVAALGLAAMGWGQTPTAAEQGQFLEDTRATALVYSELLPDFVCTETIHRSASDAGVWRNLDSLTLQLTYANQKENYKVVVAGNRVSDVDYLSVGGALSVGEFGSTLRWIFEPESATTFHWEKWAVVRKTPVAVYSYRVPQANSHFVLAFGEGADMQSMVVGFHGVLEIGRDSHMVRKLTTEADGIPAGFSIQASTTSVDYGYADVSGKPYLLPTSAETNMIYQPSRALETRTLRDVRPKLMRNLLEFRGYRKFAVDSEIDFGGDGKP